MQANKITHFTDGIASKNSTSKELSKFVYKTRYMTNAAIRHQLHQYIDVTDDKKIEALYTLLQNDIDPAGSYTAEELDMLHERAEKYLKGETKTYTVAESHNMIRQQRKQR